MKHIGIVDYYLSEWHADNYPAWLRTANEALELDYAVSYAYGELEISPVDGVSNDEWCQKNGIERIAAIEELCEKSDGILILAPSNPEKHLEYAEKVLPYGKPVFIDKTFTSCLDEAKTIFALAETYNAPMFSSSALRYSEELADFKEPRALIITGGGGNFPEYVIHQLEMLVKLMPASCLSVSVEQQADQKLCHLEFEDGKLATLIYAPSLPFAVCAEETNGHSLYRVMKSDYFMHEMEEILRLFSTGKTSFDGKQTLEAIAMRDALLLADSLGKRVSL